MEKDLQKRYSDICNEYVRAFEKKHDIAFEFWIGDRAGDIAVFGDYFFGMRDITTDIDNDLPGDMVFDWYDYRLNLSELGLEDSINLETYSKGVRPYSEEAIKRIDDLRMKVVDAQHELDNEVLKLKKDKF